MISKVLIFVVLIFVVLISSFSNADKESKKGSAKDWKVKLNSGYSMPMIGLGTWLINTQEITSSALDLALEAGFRLIDTAQSYDNEEYIGNALKELLPKHNLTREDIFITSKIHPRKDNPDGYEAVKESLKKLQTNYIDLYMVHNSGTILATHTNPDGTKRCTLSQGPKNAVQRDAKWQALVKAKKEGLVKSIGVSNYAVKHLKELLANDHGVRPAVNEINWSPFYQPRDILEFCKNESIAVIGYYTLGSTGDAVKIREDPRVVKIAEKLGKSTAQVLLKWSLQHGVAVIPKATTKAHLEEDLALDFVIPEEDMKILDNFEQKPPLFDIDNVD